MFELDFSLCLRRVVRCCVAALQVLQVRDKPSGEMFAMKIMRKDRTLERERNTYVRAERDVLTSAVHPYIVQMRIFFQTLVNLPSYPLHSSILSQVRSKHCSSRPMHDVRHSNPVPVGTCGRCLGQLHDHLKDFHHSLP